MPGSKKSLIFIFLTSAAGRLEFEIQALRMSLLALAFSVKVGGPEDPPFGKNQ
jgi:hypothetical protein